MPPRPFTVLLTVRAAAAGSPQDASEIANPATASQLRNRFMGTSVVFSSRESRRTRWNTQILIGVMGWID